MKNDIHPEYKLVTATCSCGNVIKVGSTLGKEELNLDICSACHPFYTGTQRVVDTGGRIDKFKKRFGALSSK
ncbi:50S ribosomal protein L31 [Psychromonas sp.]|nr:50S ribosomal protein L31 [Psychromonas sp.]